MGDATIVQDLDEFLEARLDDYVSEIAALCAVPSVSAKGEGIEECADLVTRMLADRGFEIIETEAPGNPIILAHAPGHSDKTLLYYNHYDVQPPEPLELWSTPPFEPDLRDGALHARGARDDKGEFVSRLAAVDAVRAAHGGDLPCGVTFLVEGEEEIGSPHLVEFVHRHKEHLNCHGAIWEEGGIDHEGRALLELGVRGILYVEISVETMSQDAHSGEAHVLPSAAWRLHRALDSLKGPDDRVRIPGFYDGVQPPTPRELELLDALPPVDRLLRDQFGVQTFVRDLSDNDIHRAVYQPTCNIAGLSSGYHGEGMKTIIPATASAKLDFRLVPDQDPDDVFDKLTHYLAAGGFEDVRVTRLGSMSPAKTDPDDPLVKLALETGEAVYGKPSLITPLRGVSSPIYAIAGPLGGIPVIRAGVGYWDNRGHAPDEHVRVIDFLNASRHLSRILEGFAHL